MVAPDRGDEGGKAGFPADTENAGRRRDRVSATGGTGRVPIPMGHGGGGGGGVGVPMIWPYSRKPRCLACTTQDVDNLPRSHWLMYTSPGAP